MKMRITPVFIGLLIFCTGAIAQTNVLNGDFEHWKLKEFKCCGRNLDVPWYWGMTEQLTGLNYNKFIFRVTDTTIVHSGIESALLYSDTTYLNNLILIPGVLSYGGLTDSASTSVTISPVIQAKGYPISSNPSQLNFFMKMNHAETDTPYYIYLFTNWNFAAQKEDTLAYAQIDIPDNDQTMNQWVSYTDTIHYLMPGTADTVRLIFFGGRFGNASLQGNATYLDDVSFYYPATGLVALDGGPVLQVYPNPSYNQLTIKTGQYKPGNSFRIFDALGRSIKSVPIETYVTTVDLRTMEAGDYFYRLSDKNNTFLTGGRFTVVK